MKSKFSFLNFGRVVALSLLASTSSLFAGEYEAQITQQYRQWTMPGISTASPAAFGANWGQFFFGGGYQNRTRGTQVSDGSVSAGLGFGDSQKYVGLEAIVSLLDLSGFNRGSVNLKLHRNLPSGFAVGVGREGTLVWGLPTDSASWFGAVSKIFFLSDETKWFSALTFTIGAGNGRFNVNNNINQIGFFGTAAVRVKEPVAIILDWTGQNLNAGLSITPIRTVGLFINPALVDLTSTTGNGVRFVLSGGLAMSFL